MFHFSGVAAVGLAVTELDSEPGVLEDRSRWSVRIALLTICLTGLVNFELYSAGLTSTLTYEEFTLPINSLQQLESLKDNYEVISPRLYEFLFLCLCFNASS